MKEKGVVLPFILVGGLLLLIVLISLYIIGINNKSEPNYPVQTTVQVTPSSNPTLTASPQPRIYYIKLLSPLGNEKWQVGKNETISWDQQGLDHWGNQVKICLFAVDENKSNVPPQSKWVDQLCTHKLGTTDGAYLIADTVLTNKKYEWTIPSDFFARFKKKPAAFKISLQVYDNLPSAARTEWAGLVGDDESPNYFEISTN